MTTRADYYRLEIYCFATAIPDERLVIAFDNTDNTLTEWVVIVLSLPFDETFSFCTFASIAPRDGEHTATG